MARNPRVEVVIAGDPRGLNRAFKSAGGHAKGFGKSMAAVGKVAAVGFAALGAGAVVAGKHLFEVGTDLDAWRNKAEIVFGESIDLVDKWAAETAHAMGLTSAEAVNAASSMADLLKPMGFTAKQAAEMSTDIVGLSGALAEWSGGQYDAAEVSEILSKALLGEREQLKSLGISITEADVQARLAAKGQEELTGAALAQAKALATQELILEKSTDAQEAYAENSDTLQRKQAELGARIRELRDRIATVLVPAFMLAAEWALEHVVPAIETMGEWLATHLPGFIETASTWISDYLVDPLSKVYGWLERKVPEAIDTFAGAWDTFISSEQVSEFIATMQTAWQEFTGWLQTAFPEVMGGTRSEFVQTQGVLGEMNDWWQNDAGTWRDIYDYFAVDMPDMFRKSADGGGSYGAEMWGVGHAVDFVHFMLEGMSGLLTDDLGPVMLAYNTVLLPAWNHAWGIGEVILGSVWDRIMNLKDGFIDIKDAFVDLYNNWQEKLRNLASLWGPVGIAIWSAVDGVIAFIRESSKLSGLATYAPGGENFNPDGDYYAEQNQNRPRSALVPAANSVTVNVQGSVLSDRDLEWKLQDMRRRGVLG